MNLPTSTSTSTTAVRGVPLSSGVIAAEGPSDLLSRIAEASPEPPSTPRLQIHLLGTPQVMLDWTPITFARRRTVAMLAFLAVTGRPQPRETLMALLTAEHAGERASKHISNSLTELRQQLKDYIEADRHAIALSPNLTYSLDTHDLENALDAPADAAQLTALEEATNLYRGDFLEGVVLKDVPEFDEWQARERARLHAAYVRALRTTVEAALEHRRFEIGLRAADRLLSLEPWDEEGIRHLMTLHARAGDRLRAQAEYEEYRGRLREELEAQPEPRTTLVYRRIRAAAALPPHNLPAVARATGRESEIEHLTQLLASEDGRVINVVGLGGSGKTRIALDTAFNYSSGTIVHEQPFSDGVFVVSMGGPHVMAGATPIDPSGEAERPPLAAIVCAHLGIHAESPERTSQALVQALREKSLLLLLDGADDVREDLPALIRLLAETRGVRVVVTTRTRLEIDADHVVEIWGFPIPETHEGVEWSDAGALFHSEAERTAGSITFDDNERRALVELCRETDGLPLALVIAAEFTKTMSIQEILENVRRDIRFLESTHPTAEPRRNLHSVLDHAWGNVDGHAQEALRRLAVIQGNFDVDAARAIARVSHAELSMLRDACLLESLGPGVYRIPRLVRRHVWDTAPIEADELDELRARHAAFFARALSARSYGLVRSTDTELPAYLPELDDLIAACEWAAATSQISVIVEIREGVALWCELTGHVEEGLQLLSRTESALATAVDATPDDPILPSVLHHVRLAEARLLTRLGRRELAASKIPELEDGTANSSSNDAATVRHLRRGEGALAAGDIRSATEHFGSALHMAMSSHTPVQAAVSSARLGAAFWRARQTRDSKNDEQPT